MRQVTADDLQGRLRQARSGRELVDTVLDEAGVEVHARPGLTDRDLRRERDVNAVGVGDFAQHPLGEHHLVGGIQGVHGQEFNLLLNHLTAAGHEVTDLRVGVLDRAAHGHQVQQGFRAHALPLREGARFVVAALRFDGEQVLLVGEEVVLEFAEGLQLAACLFLQGALSLAQDLLRCRGQGLAVDVVEAAQDIQGRNVREGVEEGRGQAGHDVQVRGGRLDEGEERGAVDALPQRQHTIQVCL